MKIAFISFEYPPDTARGGIATYVYNAANMLKNAGEYVEVFTGTTQEQSYQIAENGILVHRISAATRNDFAVLVGNIFAERHQVVGFDVLEGPEYCAEASYAIKQVPDIPLVVKLHTPRFFVDKLNRVNFGMVDKLHFMAAGLLRGKLNKPFWVYEKQSDLEYHHIKDADEIVSPSKDLGKIVSKYWEIDSTSITHLPNPYTPSQELLQIPIDTSSNTVTFIGKLEQRKGVHLLVDAIPQVLKKLPFVKFRFIGRDMPSPVRDVNMVEYINQKLGQFKNNVEFTGEITPAELAKWLKATDVCVFPSLWENFPNVCLEAMSAGRGVIGSNKGGMMDMMEDQVSGVLISPDKTDQLADAIIKLIQNKSFRMELGSCARDRVLTAYNSDKISKLQIESYTRAINKRRRLGSRTNL